MSERDRKLLRERERERERESVKAWKENNPKKRLKYGHTCKEKE